MQNGLSVGDVSSISADHAVANPIQNAHQIEILRGKVVKFSPEIMGKNWIHLRDGSGTAAAKNNDLVLTTKDQAKIGAVVTVKGILRTDKDFGHGYAYEVIIEDASVSSK